MPNLAGVLVLGLQLCGIVLAFCTRFPQTSGWSIPIYRGVLAILSGVTLACAGQSPEVWGMCLLTFAIMLLAGLSDFSRHLPRKTV